MSKYNIDIYCVAITTNIENNKIYILSTDKDTIRFPFLEINNTNVDSIDSSVIDHMRKFLMTSHIELIPQIISANCSLIKQRRKHTLNIVYGFLLKENIKQFDSYWIDFDYQNPKTEYSNLIFEVIQKLK